MVLDTEIKFLLIFPIYTNYFNLMRYLACCTESGWGGAHAIQCSSCCVLALWLNQCFCCC